MADGGSQMRRGQLLHELADEVGLDIHAVAGAKLAVNAGDASVAPAD